MPLPRPVPGLVIRYSYLWRQDFLRGLEEGHKDRPCAVILVSRSAQGEQVVTVLPISHSPASNPAEAIEISSATKLRLKLDSQRSWIVLTEANRFIWPGPDLRPSIPGDMTSVAYGLLPGALYEQMRSSFAALLRSRQSRVVIRES